ncbi:188L [Invertebrate iridescent virus 6]|uniref:188L n=1 Tax=Invertebrate iridescent virus 6 TaxID=176652 RepID=Q91FX8_IIV6|nr:188L [Invertebrate iridescent virus 6]AAK82054.1 188L [Invertebrate iridescent virus 6]QMS79566.1 hypothetical protein IIV6-T1_188 [Invertebrate iridescent virus 6]
MFICSANKYFSKATGLSDLAIKIKDPMVLALRGLFFFFISAHSKSHLLSSYFVL